MTENWVKSAVEDLAAAVGASAPAEAIGRAAGQIELLKERAEKLYPQGVEESRGIAEGAGIAESDYFAAMFGWTFAPEAPRRCTTLGFRDACGRPLLAKTDDVRRHEAGSNILEITWPDAGYRHVHMHFAGTIWTVSGMNERGLSIAMTGIPGVTQQAGITPLEALHAILPECADVNESLELIRQFSIGVYGFSLLLGDRQGGLALVEKTGAGTVVLPPEDGVVHLHTNHIIDATFAGRNLPQAEPVNTNGRRRLARGRRIVPSLPRTEEGMQAFLDDHDAPGAIWQEGADGMHTDFGVIMLPAEGRMIIEQGPMRFRQKEEISLAAIFTETR